VKISDNITAFLAIILPVFKPLSHIRKLGKRWEGRIEINNECCTI
jgi:hypothetical protein